MLTDWLSLLSCVVVTESTLFANVSDFEVGFTSTDDLGTGLTELSEPEPANRFSTGVVVTSLNGLVVVLTAVVCCNTLAAVDLLITKLLEGILLEDTTVEDWLCCAANIGAYTVKVLFGPLLRNMFFVDSNGLCIVVVVAVDCF